MEKIAVIAGATGLTGTFLLDFLLEDRYYDKIVVLTRRSTERKAQHLEEHCLDFEQLPQFSLPYSVRDVFCCLGITRRRAGSVEKARRVEYDYPLQLAQWGLRHEARQFLCVSSQGANPQARHYYFRTKGQLEEALKSLAYPTLHLLRPALLTGPRNEVRPAEDLARVLLTAFAPFIPLRYRALPARTVAKYLQLLAQKQSPGQFVHESARIRRIAYSQFDMKEMQEKIFYREI